MTTVNFPAATIVGYPRIGRFRELKKAVEAFWKGAASRSELDSAVKNIQQTNLKRLQELGLSEDYAIPASFSHYDQVLDAIRLFTAVPQRFADSLDNRGLLPLEGYFDLARGTDAQPALELTKWFDTNYHYLVPELGEGTEFKLNTEELEVQLDAAAEVGVKVRPQVVGPLTFLLLAKGEEGAAEDFSPLSRLEDLLAQYEQLLAFLAERGVQWVQFDEPALVADQDVDEAQLGELIRSTYQRLTGPNERPSILVTSPYGDLEHNLTPLAESGVESLHVDTISAEYGPRLAELAAADGPHLVVGAVNGRNIWRTDLSKALGELTALHGTVSVATSTSLQHVPHDLDLEEKLSDELKSWLAFADQKVAEILTLAKALAEGAESVSAELDAATQALAQREQAPGVHDNDIRERVANVTGTDGAFDRPSAAERQAAQARLNLPTLPTTIGSFPQTGDIRKQRAAFRASNISQEELDGFLREEIASVIKLQEEIGLDVLVHGEAERNDMVQYFAEHFDGFDTTVHG